MAIIILSLDSGSEAQCAALWNEVERTLGFSNDPLDELIADEEDYFDIDYAITYVNALHRRAHGVQCSFPSCNIPCNACRSCKIRERMAR